MENKEARMMEEQEIYLSDIIAALKLRKKLIFTCTGVSVLIGLLYAIFSTPLYTAVITMRPLEAGEGGALSKLSTQFGGAAALAGISLGEGGSDKDEYIAILRSRDLAGRFIKKYGLMPYLFPKLWDDQANKWKDGKPGMIGRAARGVSKALAALSGDEGWKERGPVPTMWDAYKIFNAKIRSVAEDKKTGIVTLSMKTRDPALAAEWANAYVTMANEAIRKDAVAEATRALTYLNRQADKATVTGLRDTIYSVIEGQLKKIMLANARPEYAFRVIDKAVVPEERSQPKRALIVLLSLVLGGILGAFIALVQETYRGLIGCKKAM